MAWRQLKKLMRPRPIRAPSAPLRRLTEAPAAPHWGLVGTPERPPRRPTRALSRRRRLAVAWLSEPGEQPPARRAGLRPGS
jgi:hypothetical protein